MLGIIDVEKPTGTAPMPGGATSAVAASCSLPLLISYLLPHTRKRGLLRDVSCPIGRLNSSVQLTVLLSDAIGLLAGAAC